MKAPEQITKVGLQIQNSIAVYEETASAVSIAKRRIPNPPQLDDQELFFQAKDNFYNSIISYIINKDQEKEQKK